MPSKYRNSRIKIDNYTFDSKAEAARYEQLRLLLLADEIRDLIVHPVYNLTVNGKHVCKYIPDFHYRQRSDDEWELVVEDVKGVRTDVYKLKKRLMKAVYNIDVIEISVK